MNKINPAMLDQAVELLKRMISIPSFSREEEFLANFFEKHCRELGLAPRRHQNNVWMLNTHFDPEKQTILLNSHIDTVKPSSAYTRDPFGAVVEDGKRG